MAKITISYRRDDTGIIVGRIFDRLVAHYGADTVFRDIDNIPYGVDYRKYINEALDRTDILLAIVGPNWTGKTTDGHLRIAEPTDLVRIEVEAALRKDIPVVPVLIANATMPQPNDLPDVLQGFAYRHALKVDALEDFDDHVRRLIRSLDRTLESIGGARQGKVEPDERAEQQRPRKIAKQEAPRRAEDAQAAEKTTAEEERRKTNEEVRHQQQLTEEVPSKKPVADSTAETLGKASVVQQSSGRRVTLALGIVFVIGVALVAAAIFSFAPSNTTATSTSPDEGPPHGSMFGPDGKLNCIDKKTRNFVPCASLKN